MLKKVLTTTMLGVSALGMMAANAAAPGIYVTGQLGYANTDMGSKLGKEKLPRGIIAEKDKLSNNGLAGRLAVGYQFNPYSAVELGYLQLGGAKTKVTIDPNDPEGVGKIKLNQNAIDLVGKGIVPIASNFNLYGKLGVAYLTTSIDGKLDIDTVPVTADLNNAAAIAKHKWAPEAAVGVSYDVNSHVSIDTSWTHIQPLGNKRPGNIDFVAVGVGYNFG